MSTVEPTPTVVTVDERALRELLSAAREGAQHIAIYPPRSRLLSATLAVELLLAGDEK